ncbi:MAG TPA: glycosyltransferase, partial [Pirellulaceae bacterium]
GHRPASEIAWCYDHCRVFVMTSRTEACPNVVLESLAHGCLAVSTAAPPMPEFFRNCALTYQAGSATSLASQLRIVDAWTPRQRAARSERALDRAREFSWDLNIATTLASLRRACRIAPSSVRRAA